MKRDFTQKQFDAALERNGFSRTGFMGGYETHLSGGQSVSISSWIPETNRREKIAYLLAARDRMEATECAA